MENLLSERSQATPASFIRNILKVAADPNIISFAGGLPNPISFPQEELLVSMNRIVKEHGSKVFQYAATAGLPELRQYIVDRYHKKYGLTLEPDEVLITTGSQQALDLIGKSLINKGDGVIVERPGYLGAIQAFSQYQPTFHPVTLSEEGLNLEELEATLQKPIKCAYVVPNFQNPTGLTYSAKNREAVYSLLDKHNTVLIEDDPYGEIRFAGESLPYIGAGKLENSILLGTFSKTVTPGMRIGFLITKNKTLMKAISKAKEASDLHTDIFAQYLLWDYLTHNDIDEHIEKIRALYKNQSKTMMDAMDLYFPKEVTYTKPEGGMFIWVTLPAGISALQLFPKAIENFVSFVPGDPFYTDEKDCNTMRLNYTNSSPEIIVEGIKRLGSIIKIAMEKHD